jgi:biotin transport system substrate-specific component
VLTVAPTVIGARVVGASRLRSRLMTAALVTGFALLTGFSALWEIPLGFTPVPVTGQTFAVLLAGAALGFKAGAASQLLYLAMGVVGMPFFAGGASGWEIVTGPTVGYLIGFVVASAVVGRLAEAKADRRVLTSIPAFAAGSIVIYFFGMIGLMTMAGMGIGQAFTLGVVPFLVGDALKAVGAGLLLPAAWRLSARR